MLILRDISDNKWAQRQLQEAMEKAEEVSRLKSHFLASMSHDVRSPLTGIIGFADILTEECSGDQAQFAGMIRDSGTRLLKLINSMLSVSHLSSGTLDRDFQRINLIDISRTVIAPFERDLAGSGVVLDVLLPDEKLEILQDGTHLSHALSQVMAFATRNTSEGTIQFKLETSDRHVVFRVADSGKGFSPAFVASISQPLDLSNLSDLSSKDETGLGLRVANGLIEEMGGKMEIQSTLNKGSICTILIPEFLKNGDFPKNSAPNRPAILPQQARETHSGQANDHPSGLPKSV